MLTLLRLSIPEAETPDTRWPDRILEAHPEGKGSMPSMRQSGCRWMFSAIEGRSAVLMFQWSGAPRPGALGRDAFVDWWGRESGWDYKVETLPTGTAYPPKGAVYGPDDNGRPCSPPPGGGPA